MSWDIHAGPKVAVREFLHLASGTAAVLRFTQVIEIVGNR